MAVSGRGVSVVMVSPCPGRAVGFPGYLPPAVQGSGSAVPIVSQPSQLAPLPGPPSSSAPVRPPSPRSTRDSKLGRGFSGLASGSHAPDSCSEGNDSGGEGDDDESLPVNEVYSSVFQRLSGALDVLLEVAPDLFSEPGGNSTTQEVSGIEEILGCSSGDRSFPELQESKLVASALRSAFQRASNLGGKFAERETSPRLLPSVRPWLRNARWLRLRHVSLPERPLLISDAERDLVSANNFPLAFSLSDKTLASWEEQLLFGLENLSLADALLSGVGKMLMLPSDSGTPSPLTSAGVGGNWHEELFLVLSSLGQCLSSLSSGLATSYTNVVLTRRDALLSKSKVPPPVRSSFRLLPLSNSLFGPQVTDMLHQVSERARDAAFLRPQQAPASGSRGSFSARGGGSGKRRFGGRGGRSPQRKRARLPDAPPRAPAPARRSSGRGGAKALPPQ